MDLVRPLFQRFALVRMKFGRPIARDLHPAIFPDQIPPRQKLFQPPEKRILPCGICQAEVQLQHLFIQFFHKSRLLHDPADGCAIQEPTVRRLIIVERLRPELIPQAEQFLLLLVPQGKRKHSVHMVCHLAAPFFICLY